MSAFVFKKIRLSDGSLVGVGDRFGRCSTSSSYHDADPAARVGTTMPASEQHRSSMPAHGVDRVSTDTRLHPRLLPKNLHAESSVRISKSGKHATQ